MKKKLIVILITSALLAVPSTMAYAHSNIQPEAPLSIILLQKQDKNLRATDSIVYKYRTANGVLQYRRWNQSKGYWVDPYWINVK